MKKSKRVTSLFMLPAFLCAAMFAGSITASAAGFGPAAAVPLVDVSGITTWLNGISSSLKTIAAAIAGISIIALAILFITGGSQGLQKGKGMAISILVGVAVLAVGTSVVASLVSSAGGTPAS